MLYRREIDGLRALAVVPVVFFHAGFMLFRGGFVGVDVFFVISGYLISTILLNDLIQNKFSITNFYERRARRILPALFTVMAVGTLPACFWMLPDELKNYGQSLVATTLFSNNILLALTSNYWGLTAEFKPLLHTWSLGVEEQYYVFYPILLWLCWRFLRKKIELVLSILALASFGFALWFSFHYPAISFYLLPTRGWEIFSGALAAVYQVHGSIRVGERAGNLLSSLGLMMITASFLIMNENLHAQQVFMTVPVAGTVLVVLFASQSNWAGKLLGTKPMVAIGLISYSFYLWHQPFFAFARVYSKNPPSHALYLALILSSLAVSWFSWRFIESPFRDRKQVGRKALLAFSLAGSAAFIAFGVYLNQSYGMLFTMYDPHVVAINIIDKRIYNERVFQYKATRFATTNKLRILVLGNSYARDFVNIATENLDVSKVEFVYRDDFGQCIYPFKSALQATLYTQADVVVNASWDPDYDCVQPDISYLEHAHKKYFYVGNKEYGFNLNWIKRLPVAERANQYDEIPDYIFSTEIRQKKVMPPDHFISMLDGVEQDGALPVTDEQGYPICLDRKHVTKFGAIYYGQRVLIHSKFADLIKSYNSAATGN